MQNRVESSANAKLICRMYIAIPFHPKKVHRDFFCFIFINRQKKQLGDKVSKLLEDKKGP